MTAGFDLPAALGRHRVLPVLVLDDPRRVEAVASGLVRGGLPLVEVTLRTARALEVLAAFGAVADELGLLVGAGTVRSARQAELAVEAGARFLVSPGWDDGVVERAHALAVPVMPGVATATELQRALGEGVDVVKLFPASMIGGVAAVEAFASPFPDARFVPTGGITQADAADYLAQPAVLAVGGTWMVPRDAVSAGDSGLIERLVGAALSLGARPVTAP